MNMLLTSASAVVLAFGSALPGGGPASAAAHGAAAAVVVHFSFQAGETPENAAPEPDGDFDVSFSVAREIARVGLDGRRDVLAAMPRPVDGGINTPVLHFAATMGIVRGQDGTLYFLYAAGNADLTGVWRLRPNASAPQRIAALPATSLPNGLALDPHTGMLYVADSALGRIWAVPATGGTATVWSAAPELAPAGYLGANGLKVHGGAVWVSNTDQGTVVRIPVLPDGAPGPARIRAGGLPTIDDFAFTGDEILAAVNHTDTVVRIRPDGTETIVLTGADGLQNPTSVVLRGGGAYVFDAAYVTHTDPNILRAPLWELR
jgi:sugar lactone lactonase YvrE